jgi:1,4-dihydroxy-2-naphthoate octaprenyltransferase
MKTLLRIAAVLSFVFFLIGGLCILSRTLSSVKEDAFALTALGFFFVGTAFFVGPILLAAAKKLS